MTMSRRGRPPHPDVLTPREWDVLTLVRDGLTNPQIADRLGITMDAVKYHVSEILSKLDLSSREEAAAWQPEPPERPVLRPVWARALARWWPALAWAGAAAVLVGLGILLYGVLRDSGDDNDSVDNTGSPTATSAASTSGSVTPNATPAGAIPLVLTSGIGLPADIALIYETGCWQCDGPTTGLSRVYRAADGNYISQVLFTPATVGQQPIHTSTPEKPNQEFAPQIAGFAIAPDASDIVVGTSYGVNLGGTTEITYLWRSLDGGITWTDFGTLPAGDFISGELVGDQVIVGHYDPNQATVAPSSTPFYAPPNYRLFPGGDAIENPDGASALWRVTVLGDGSIGWLTDDGRLLNADGDELHHVASGGQIAFAPHLHEPAFGTAVAWQLPNGNPANYIDFIDNKDDTPQTYRVKEPFFASTWINATTILGNVQLPYPSPLPTGPTPLNLYPAIFDLKSNSIQPITEPFSGTGFAFSRNLVTAAQTGALALVRDTGSCLNVRSEAGSSADVVNCAADGVLLTNLGVRAGAEGQLTWLKVRTPAGEEGWASTDFLTVLSEPPSGD